MRVHPIFTAGILKWKNFRLSAHMSPLIADDHDKLPNYQFASKKLPEEEQIGFFTTVPANFVIRFLRHTFYVYILLLTLSFLTQMIESHVRLIIRSRTLISCHIDPESEFEITPTASVNCYLCCTELHKCLERCPLRCHAQCRKRSDI